MPSKTEMNARVYEIPTSAIVINKKRINYHKFLTSIDNKDCKDAIKRIVPRINLDKINELIDGVEQLDNLHREFLKKILKMRKELILDKAFLACD